MGSQWYKGAVLYEVDVRAFYDSNGDGIGDIPGLVDKLHYLHELGVTALVIGPRSASCPGGTGSAANWSTPEEQDVERFVREAHGLRIHVIIEVLVDQMFDRALDTGVRDAFERAIRYWLDAGVDGIKIRITPTLGERHRAGGVKLMSASAILKETRSMIDNHYAGRVIVVEANRSPDDPAAYFGHGEQCHMAFNVSFMPRLLMAVKQERRTLLLQTLRRMTDIPASCQWAMALRHQDELSLESCTEAERDEIYGTYASEPGMRFHTGIRRRLAPLFDNDRRRISLAYALMFSLPGSPMIYYGDEIGMGDNVHLDDCTGLRTPMQWSSGRNAGFSLADSARLTVPANAGLIYGYETVNVEAQKRQPSSLFNWMRRLIAVRRHHPVFGQGSIDFLEPGNEAIVAYVRRHREDRVLVVANLSGKEQSVDLALDVYAGTHPLELLGGTTFRRIGADPYSVTLGPYGCLWLLMSRLATRPSTSFDMATVAPGSHSGATDAPAARTERLPYREVCERTE